MLSVEVQTLGTSDHAQQLVAGPFTVLIKQQLGSFNTLDLHVNYAST
jgi:hypothetical protein